mgnify:FL=1
MLSKEISRLRDKDIRQRRKAVRRLFEDGDPSALPHFIPFLNDPDEWFVERAMIAIERWYDGMDKGIAHALANSEFAERRLLAARVALRLENPRGTLSELTRDGDLKVRIAAWKGLMRLDSEESKNALKSKDTAVRKMAVDNLFESGLVNEKVMNELMSDPASAVRNAVAKNISDRNLDDSAKGAYDRFVNARMGVEDASEAIIESPVLALRLAWVQQYLASTNPKDVTLLTKGFRNSSWMEEGAAVDMVLEHASDQLLERILRRGKGDYVEGVCLRVIRDRNRSSSTKARVVLDRIGRDPSPEFAESLSAEDLITDDELSSSISLLVRETLGADSGMHEP